MELILCENVEKIGKIGDVIKVKDGFARNYLLPRKLAYPATPGNIKKIEQQKIKRNKAEENIQREAEALAEKLNKVSCTVTVEVNDLDKLYGSVSEIDIAKALADEGFSIDKKNIRFDVPIEQLGIFEVNIHLHPKVIAKVRLWVAKK